MCLIALAVDRSGRFPLVVASNRDEFLQRPTAPLDWWVPRRSVSAVLSGRDLEAGGTWLGLNAAGRIAMLTNLRGVLPHDASAPSRGRIVTDWLAADESRDAFWTRSLRPGYNGFNLVAGDLARGELFWGSNSGAAPRPLERGVHGVSNGALDAPWPKVVALKTALAEALDGATSSDALADRLFAALAERRIAADDALPRTGIPLERERMLSAAFIRAPDLAYGTRCSTLVISEQIGAERITQVLERSFDAAGALRMHRRALLRGWPPPPGDDGRPAAPVEPMPVEESLAGAAWRDAHAAG